MCISFLHSHEEIAKESPSTSPEQRAGGGARHGGLTAWTPQDAGEEPDQYRTREGKTKEREGEKEGGNAARETRELETGTAG